MSPRTIYHLVVFATFLGPVSVPAQNTPTIVSYQDIHHPIFAEQGMVSTQEELASRVGLEVLQNGGNAIDAGVAIGFTLAVTLPRAGNLGGGGFMLIHSASRGETVAIDYRETAPAAATRDMYLDELGNVDKDKSRYSYHSVGVPGTVAGLALALREYGTWSPPPGARACDSSRPRRHRGAQRPGRLTRLQRETAAQVAGHCTDIPETGRFGLPAR